MIFNSPKQYEALGFKSLQDLERFLDREDIKQLIGKNYDLYRAVWVREFDKVVNKETRDRVKGAFNWLALISFPIWAAYRKMYMYFFVYAGIMAAITFFEEYYLYTLPAGALLPVYIILAIMSRDLYLHHLVELDKKMDMLRDFKKEEFIKHHGGVSKLYAWLALPAFIILMLVVMFAGSYAGGHGNPFERY
ncbi:MAG: DUF2628 domain-containing protein [Alphaproteobacteria bacterium]|nr:DUF2628 domain-containing protein [Alphaproteobacteria bacterium]